MSKILTSPVKKWPGTVTLASPLLPAQYSAWKIASRNALALQEDKETRDNDDIMAALVPGICACIEQVELAGITSLTPENFPQTPRKAWQELVLWLMGEVTREVRGDDEIPLDSSASV